MANAAAAAEKKFVAAARRSSAGEDGHSSGNTGGRRAQGADHDPLLGAMTMQEVDFNEALIEEREQGVAEIAAAVQEVNEVFRDLATLVDEQGRDIDQIELNIVDAHAETEGGVAHLEKAAQYQKSYRKWILILILILVLAAGGITAGVVLSKR